MARRNDLIVALRVLDQMPLEFLSNERKETIRCAMAKRQATTEMVAEIETALEQWRQLILGINSPASKSQ